MQASRQFIGVDVSKAELVMASAPGGASDRISNDAASIARWLERVPAGAAVAMESTGRYHGLLARMAQQAGLAVYVLNARDVYYYAKALGTRAKTDGVDAAVIARYLVERHAQLRVWQPGGAVHEQIMQLLKYRAQLVGHRQALRQAHSGMPVQGLPVAGLRTAFDALLKGLDAKLQALIDSDAQLSAGYRRLAKVSGFGPQGAALLATLLSRVPFANSDALVAYSGLDPRPNDSGGHRGRRRLTKRGPALLRRQIFLAGLGAKNSKALKPLYQAIRAKGFSTTESLLILGRKLLRVAFAVWKGTEPFDPARLVPKMT